MRTADLINLRRRQLAAITMPEPTAGGANQSRQRYRDNQIRADHQRDMKSTNDLHLLGSSGRNSSFKREPYDFELRQTSRYTRRRTDAE